MLRWRNWGLQYVGEQDRALKLCPGPKNVEGHPASNPWGSGTGEHYVGGLFFKAVANKSTINLPNTQYISLNTQVSKDHSIRTSSL